MSLADEYRQQAAWRPWPEILSLLPPVGGCIVLDLGCGIGDQAALLAARGARVIGFDANEALLGEARARAIPGAEFRAADLRSDFDPGVPADGIWSSFAAAYFPDLPAALARWCRRLVPGGFVALAEIDDLFGHEPLGAAARALLDGYAEDALAAGRYDFHMGRKLCAHLEAAGFAVERQCALTDRELAFDGPAFPAVLDAWRKRLERMTLLQAFCGERYGAVRDELLACLADARHRSRARVHVCIARRRV
jgi:SAM-dependent methyltransferase